MGADRVMKIGIIARSDNTGLGNQTMELVKMLNPDKIMLIDSSKFNSNKQHPERYSGYNYITTKMGFASSEEVRELVREVDVIISCETFYNNRLAMYARKRGVKTVLQYNYEFLDNLSNPDAPLPDVLLAPSVWNLEDVEDRFGRLAVVEHLPPPTDPTIFAKAKNNNLKRHKKLLHIAGKVADKDRNGTESVIEMMKHSTADFTLDIKTQSDIKIDFDDDRIKIIKDNVEDHADMYSGYDAMVLPRRYAGLCLPMNEALMSGLPVFMTDVSPNNHVLPAEWLVKSSKIDTLMTRTMLNVYSADPKELAKIVDNYMSSEDLAEDKKSAYEIGHNNFATDVLRDKYNKVLSRTIAG